MRGGREVEDGALERGDARLRCPRCLSRREIHVHGQTIATVQQIGDPEEGKASVYFEQHGWTPSSEAYCLECHFRGPVFLFEYLRTAVTTVWVYDAEAMELRHLRVESIADAKVGDVLELADMCGVRVHVHAREVYQTARAAADAAHDQLAALHAMTASLTEKLVTATGDIEDTARLQEEGTE